MMNKKILLICILCLGFEILLLPKIYSLSNIWGNSSFPKCRNITITNVGNTELVNFTAYINLTYDSDMQADYDDVRFYNASCYGGGSQIYHEIENYTDESAHVWVMVDNITLGTRNISVYYGNSSVDYGTNSTEAWDDNYVAVYHLDEGSGTSIKDSKSSYEGTSATSDHWITSEVVGKAYNFDGTDDGITINDNDEFDISTWTMEAWIKPNSPDAWSGVFMKDDGSSYKWQFGPGSAGIDVANDFGTTGNWATLEADGYLTNAELHYYAIGMDNANDNQYIWKNAVQVAFDGSESLVPCDYADNADVYIGTSGGDNYFTGMIDEVRMSNVIRSTDWMNQSYQLIKKQSDYVTIFDEETEPEPVVTYNCTFYSGNKDIHIGCYYNNTRVATDGNITIYSGGELVLQNTTLDFNSTNQYIFFKAVTNQNKITLNGTSRIN